MLRQIFAFVEKMFIKLFFMVKRVFTTWIIDMNSCGSPRITDPSGSYKQILGLVSITTFFSIFGLLFTHTG